MINYNKKRFKPISLSSTSEVSNETIFHYKQDKNILTCTYSGGNVKTGHLIGIVDKDGRIDMRYHQINHNGELMTGICHSTPSIDKNGKITLFEKWEWTSGSKSKGSSTLEEII